MKNNKTKSKNVKKEKKSKKECGMSPEKLKQFIKARKDEGYDDDTLAKAFTKMYLDGDVDLEDFKTLLASVGMAMRPEVEEILRENPKALGDFKKN